MEKDGSRLDASASINTLVVNGGDAGGAYPYQVYLERNGQFVCGGVVYNKDFVLTAAHCVDAAGSYSVTCGVTDRSSGGGQTRGVSSITQNPGYTYVNSAPQNNIAVLGLASSLNLDSSCSAASFDSNANANYEGRSIDITGFGFTSGGGSPSNSLQKAEMRGMSNADCSTAWGSRVNTATAICLDSINGASACNGDSGGPASDGSNVVGLASFGAEGCGSSKPNVYTRVAAFKDFISGVADPHVALALALAAYGEESHASHLRL
nr:hypothetical protein BaRGS_001858 [Batillaria attramentaria]